MLVLGIAHADHHEAFLHTQQIVKKAVSQENGSESGLRARILKITPVGSTPQQVLHAITGVLHKSANGYHTNFYSNYYNWGDMYVPGTTGIIYDKKMSWWMTGTEMIVEWWFDEDNRLMNVTAHEQIIGP
jgi:hypothetical protein